MLNKSVFSKLKFQNKFFIIFLLTKILFLIFEVSTTNLQISSQYLQILDVCRLDRAYKLTIGKIIL